MKSRLAKGLVVFVLVVVSTGLGGFVGRFVSPAEWLPGIRPAAAEHLTSQPAGPLTPSPVGNGFTYQGRLLNNGSPASGLYDFTFSLYDQASTGSLVSGPISVTTVVTDGLFTANLDFGTTSFNGDARFMEIATRQSGGGSYSTLLPRQPITPAPYALYALKTRGYKNVVTVAQDGGDYTSVIAALNSITTNSPTNRYLVWIAPGVYTETVVMKPYVDIEGSGEGTTTISQAGSASATTGTVLGASNAELRSLTMRNTGGNTYAIAIYNSGASPSLSHVTVSATGSTSNYGVYNNTSSPHMDNVNVTATGGSGTIGILNISSSPTLENVTVAASGGTGGNYGLYSDSSSYTIVNSNISGAGGSLSFGAYNNAASGSYVAKIDNSTLSGSTNSLRSDAEFTVRVGASKLEGGAVSANGGTLDCAASYDGTNTRLGALCTPDTRVIYVATTGGDFTSVQAALNSITDNSSTNKYLVRVGPGTYTERVTMKPFVDIEGAGEDLTKITFTGSSSLSTGTVVGASNAELRSLTAESTGAFSYTVAIFNNTTSPSLLHVTAISSGGTDTSFAIANFSNNVNMKDVTASATGTAVKITIYNYFSNSVNMDNVKVTASGGTNNTGVNNVSASSVTMNNVTANIGTGSGDSFGVYNSSGAPVLNNVQATVSGGTNSFGVYNNNSSPILSNVTASGSGATTGNYGVANYNSSSPNLNYVTATGTGGTNAYGIHNNFSTPIIRNSIISASGGTSNYGMYNDAVASSYTVRVDNSTLTGSTNTIRNDSHFIVRVGSTKLDGGPVLVNGGTVSCAGVHDENYTFFTNTCP